MSKFSYPLLYCASKMAGFGVRFCLLIMLGVYLKPAVAETLILPSLTYEATTMASLSMKSERTVLIHLPQDYAAEQNIQAYPVLYVLNRGENFAISSQVVEFLSGKSNIPEMIVVGIPHNGDEHWRDEYIPYKDGEPNVTADVFLKFLTSELIPHIDDKYRTVPSRILIGHSLAGLFTMHAFLESSQSFSAFIALSPSFHHSQPIVKVAAKKLKSKEKGPAQVLYMNIGDGEYYKIRDQYDAMQQIITEYAPSNLRWHINEASNNSHRSMPLIGLVDGLTTLFHGYNLSFPQFREQGYDGVIAHYTKLSQEFGYKLRPDRGDLEDFANYFKSPERAKEPSISPEASKLAVEAERLLKHYYE